LADKSTMLILEALGRAAADPDGLPLHGGKTTAGLFAATSAGKQAARRCIDHGLLRAIRTETRGKTATEICAITEKGLTFLVAQVSPKQVLEDFVRTLDARREQIAELVDAAGRMQCTLEALRANAENVLQHAATSASAGPEHSTNGCEQWSSAIVNYLARWHDSAASEDCSLPELYRYAREAEPNLTVGQFHDRLRKLHQQQRIYLHPWTGPLYDLPEPAVALLVGHEIAYYASIRTVASGQWLVASEDCSSLATSH
jgi:hypothetical protein